MTGLTIDIHLNKPKTVLQIRSFWIAGFETISSNWKYAYGQSLFNQTSSSIPNQSVSYWKNIWFNIIYWFTNVDVVDVLDVDVVLDLGVTGLRRMLVDVSNKFLNSNR